MATRRPPTQLSAFVLHRYDWSESSLILDLFTREQGRLAVAAKGAKRPYSQLRSVLLPFQRLLVSLGKPSATDQEAIEVQTLRGAEWGAGAAMLTGAALFSGFYMNELLMKLLARNDAHPQLFDAYADTLPFLTSSDDAVVQSALRAFEFTLLRAMGVLPDLSVVSLTLQPIDERRRYAVRAEAGVSVPGPGEPAVNGGALIRVEAALQHGSLAALQQACAASLPELRSTARSLLHYHLGSSVLRTRQVMLEVSNA
ncbi:MAG: repair protein RecO [Rhizobacter sp.]|nr:repair protein RecO [Rhizobacter sp.]